MAQISYPFTLTAGQAENVNQLNSNLSAITTQVNGNLDETNLAPALAGRLGISQSGSVRRGKSIIATSETRSNAAYGLLTTPDRVSNVVLPTDGLIFISYQATWKEATATNARAAIFIGSNQLKTAQSFNAAPQVQECDLNAGGSNSFFPLTTSGTMGLVSSIAGGGGSTTAYTGDVSTGQIQGRWSQTTTDTTFAHMGGPVCVFAAAGTYDISIQFKSTGATLVTVQDRKLWVWTVGF